MEDFNGHVLYHGFGLEYSEGVGEVDELLRTAPAMLPVTADLLTRFAYQNQYGIYQHDKAPDRFNRPLALQAYHPKEDIYEGGEGFDYIRKFHRLRIRDTMSLDKFLELPPHYADLIIEIHEAELNQKNKAGSDLEDLGKELGL